MTKRLTRAELYKKYGVEIKPSFYYNMKELGYDMRDLLDNYTWIGGDGDYNRTDFSKHSKHRVTKGKRKYELHFKNSIEKEDLPPKALKCICGVNIVENCWIAKITRDSDGDIDSCEFPLPPVIGNECIENFLPDAGKWSCVKCGVYLGQKLGYDKCDKCRCTKPLCKYECCKNKKFGKSDLCKSHQKNYCWDCCIKIYGKRIRCKNCVNIRKHKN